MRRTVMPVLVLVTGLALGLGTTAQAAAPAQPSGPAKPASTAGTAETYTLPTGDRVTWPGGRITPAKGRERIDFSTHTVGKRVYVFPSDQLSEISSGQLDRRLFDLTTLSELHATDARRAKLPPMPKPAASRIDAAEETHTLTIEVLDRNGGLAQDAGTWLIGLDSDYEMLLDGPTFQADLPEGRYLLDSQITTATANGEERTRLVQPLSELDQDTTISADARVAQPLEITVPEASAELASGQVTYTRFLGGRAVYGGSFQVTNLDRHFTAQLGPSVPADELRVYVASQWGKPSGATEYWLRFLNTPYIYAVVWREPAFPTGLHRTVTESELATIDSRQFASATGSRADYSLQGYAEDGISFGSGQYAFDLPSTVTLHVSPGPFTWDSVFIENTGPDDASATQNVLTRRQAGPYIAGRTYREVWNKGVLGPEIPAWTRPAPDFYYGTELWPWFARWGDIIVAGGPMLADRGGHSNDWMSSWISVANGHSALYRNGELVENGWYDRLEAWNLDPAPATYRLETSVERPLADVSTKVSSAWTFRSAHVGNDRVAALPVSTIQFSPAVNERNQVTWQPTYTVPVTVQRQAGSTAGQVRFLDVDVSTDDGQTWVDTKLTHAGANRWLATVSTPKAGHISIRAKSADTKGNTVEQTITRAYGLS